MSQRPTPRAGTPRASSAADRPAGKTSSALSNTPRGTRPISPMNNNRDATIAGKSSALLNQPRAGRPITPRDTAPPAAAAAADAPQPQKVIAGKSSSLLNTPRGGRSLAGGKAVVSEVSGVIRGTAAAPAPDAFVHFHIKRRILPNSRDQVIVPIALATPVKVHAQGRSASAEPHRGAAPFNVGGKTFDVPDHRSKKPVASPKRKEQQPRPLLERPSQVSHMMGGGGVAMSPSKVKPVSLAPTTAKAGKHIIKQTVPKQDSGSGSDAENKAPPRFTRAPFWDETARPAPGAALAMPTKCFKAPPPGAVAGMLASPARALHRLKNESVVDRCLRAPGAPLRDVKCVQNHDAHKHSSKRCHSVDAATVAAVRANAVRAPTLSNAKTNVFRYGKPADDHGGKSTFGAERKTRNNSALEFGGNWECNGCAAAHGHGLSRVDRREIVGRSASAPRSSSVGSAGGAGARSSSAQPFRRSASNTSLIEAPFDRTTNPGKYEPTFESRTTCRKFQPYVRPVIKSGAAAKPVAVTA